jgi:gliding motility-associated-like protein
LTTINHSGLCLNASGDHYTPAPLFRELLILLLLFSVQPVFSQTEISGIINKYSRVESIVGDQAVTVANPSLFQGGDTVLLIQMKGMSMLVSPPDDYGKPQDLNNAGNYEFLLVDAIAGNTVVFTRELLKEYDAQHFVQLIKVKGYESATVTGTLTSEPWNGQTGGVLAMMVTNTLRLEANIDLSAKGFRGGASVLRGTDQCAATQPLEYGKFSFPSGSSIAGKKGEGPIIWYLQDEIYHPLDDSFIHGRGRVGTGGGGGNGNLSGGGGGSNFGQGGMGGRESESCPEFIVNGHLMGGAGGYRMEDHLINTEGNFSNRFFPGGGGGGSTGITGQPGTDGGNGGGLVIIIANHIESAGDFGIYADGKSITGNSTAGAGGGGGGGTIVSSTDHYHGTLKMYARGGKGGDVNNSLRAGPGGGGGGGAVIISGISLPAGVTTDVRQGTSGTNIQQNDPFGSTIASPGDLIEGLEISLNGLLFNGIRTGRHEICEDVQPDLIEGTLPRGGRPPYVYRWIRRIEGGDWVNIPGATGMHYLPGPLSQTTQFKRIVTDQDDEPVIDTSNLLILKVQPKILGNAISDEQLICAGGTPLSLTGNPPVQGGLGPGTFQYKWNSYTPGSGEWTDAAGTSNMQTYNPPPLFDTTLFIRIAMSGVCVDSSNAVAINVHPVIENNILAGKQSVCHGNLPQLIGPLAEPGGGLGPGSYSYAWESKTTGNWSPIGGENQSAFLPGELSVTTWFRRTVSSGVCSGTSNEHQVEILPLISENNVSGNQTICYNTSPEIFTGSDPLGGNGIYRYAWEVSGDQESWMAAGAISQERDYHSPPLTDTSWFRRIVYSGDLDACIDTSNIVLVRFYPMTRASIMETHQSICAGEQPEITFSLSGDAPPWEWTIVFSDGSREYSTGVFGSNLHSVKVSPSTADSSTYYYNIVSLTDKYGCYAPAENLSGTASVKVYAYPAPDPGSGGEICGATFELNAAAGFGNVLWESHQVAAEFSNPNGRSTTVTVKEFGTHSFMLTRTNWQCAASAQVAVTFYEQPERAFAGADQNLRFVFDTYLEASLPAHIPSAHGTWELVTGTGNIDFPGEPVTSFTEMGFGQNILKWTVYNGVCTPVSDIVTITVNDLHTPNAFSPNNNGFNDRFVIGGLENSRLNELTVFNRQGNVVYNSVNYANDWDGRNRNGDPLPEDTYFYILTVDDRYSYKGFIILKR